LEHVADDIEILDELLDEAPPETSPLHRFQGLFLFFSISLGALGLGASLAYFTRAIRPQRPVTRRMFPTKGAATPTTPGLRELVTLPLKPALGAGADEARLGSRRRPVPGPTRPRLRGKARPTLAALTAGMTPPASRPPGKAAVAAQASTEATSQEDAGKKSEPASEPATAAADPSPTSTGSASETSVSTGTAPPKTASAEKDSDAAPSDHDTPVDGPLSEAAAQAARLFLGKLGEILDDRYAFECAGIHELADGTDTLNRVHEVALPSWMNVTYLQLLVTRALKRSEQPPRALAVERGEFGAGTLRVTLGDEETPGLALTLVKPRGCWPSRPPSRSPSCPSIPGRPGR
jgi:hypothetical protein